MLPEYLTEGTLKTFISNAISEDVGDGDHSTMASINEQKQSQANLLIKDQGIIAGLELAEMIYLHLDQDLQINFNFKDGEKVKPGDLGFAIEGRTRSILTGERLVLNCLQRMSGIATYTRKLTELIEGTGAKIIDTRKTTPNFRMMEKWAVRIGGGHNHRIGLYDMIMLKDNHIDFAGGIENAIKSTKKYLSEHNKELKIEIETRDLDEVTKVIDTGGVDVIMLDNMSPQLLKEAVNLINGRYKTEASGGITEENIREIAACGVDYISVGALTHSTKSLDMSLKAFNFE